MSTHPVFDLYSPVCADGRCSCRVDPGSDYWWMHQSREVRR